MNPGTPEQLFLYQKVQSDQAKTTEGDYCRRPSCSHARKEHRAGTGPCKFALVCVCPEYLGAEGAG